MTSSLVEGVVLFVHRLISPMHQRLHQSGAPVESTDEFNNAAVCNCHPCRNRWAKTDWPASHSLNHPTSWVMRTTYVSNMNSEHSSSFTATCCITNSYWEPQHLHSLDSLWTPLDRGVDKLGQLCLLLWRPPLDRDVTEIGSLFLPSLRNTIMRRHHQAEEFDRLTTWRSRSNGTIMVLTRL